MMNFPPYLITNNTISITHNHQPYYVYKLENGEPNPKYDKVKEFIKNKDLDGLLDLLIPITKVIKKATEYFIITESNEVFMKDAEDEKLPDALNQRLIQFVDEDLPLEPLVNFWKNLRNNPSDKSKESLYRFLEHNTHSITEDGCFIAYKAVSIDRNDKFSNNILNDFDRKAFNISDKEIRKNIKLLDTYSRTIDNSIGELVTMERESVADDPNITCSEGLHVAAYNYARYSYGGDVVVEVKVNPKNVVSVPIDYNNQKMRVCEYEVLDFVDSGNEERILKGSIDTIKFDTSSYDEDEYYECGEYEDDCECEGDVENAETIVDISNKTAKEIVDLVIEKTSIKIEFNLKSKKSIIRKAKELLENNGFTVVV